jgi:DNA-binding MarR family transcriptional regulator
MHVQALSTHELLSQILTPRDIIRVAMSPRKNDQALLGAWHELAGRHARVVSALERSLETNHGLGVSEFEVLERLASSAGECRMQELTEVTHLSQSALSRLVGRLEADGLVTRAICANDRRGIYAHITDAGRARYEAARPTHRAVLAETLGS